MAINWILILRAQQMLYALLVLGLSAYGQSLMKPPV